MIIDNYSEDKTEVLTKLKNNLENEELGTREVTFSKELYIDRDYLMIDPPKQPFDYFQAMKLGL